MWLATKTLLTMVVISLSVIQTESFPYYLDCQLDRPVGQGVHLDRNVLERGAKMLRILSVVRNDDEQTRIKGHNFLLEQAATAALDQGQVTVGLISSVDRNVNLWCGLERGQLKIPVQDQLLCLS